jgi:lipoyl(octanoyl) transferase
MDLTPFLRINPCGYAGMEMVQVSQLGGPEDMTQVETKLVEELVDLLNYEQVNVDTQAGHKTNNNEK